MPTPTQQRAVYMRRPANQYDFRVGFFNPVIWLDEFSAFFQDAGTTPADAVGEVVGQWSDRSGNDFHASGTGGQRPPLVSSGGVLIPDFDGSNHRLVIANDPAFADLEAFTVAIRVAPDTTGGGGTGRFFQYDGTDEYTLRFNSSLDAVRLAVDASGTDGIATTTSAFAAGVEKWLWVTFDDAGTRTPAFYDPALVPSTDFAMTGTLAKPAGDLRIGTNPTPFNLKYDGRYRAFILFPSVLTPQNMRWIMNGVS